MFHLGHHSTPWENELIIVLCFFYFKNILSTRTKLLRLLPIATERLNWTRRISFLFCYQANFIFLEWVLGTFQKITQNVQSVDIHCTSHLPVRVVGTNLRVPRPLEVKCRGIRVLGRGSS
jgi:hypothetical protein